MRLRRLLLQNMSRKRKIRQHDEKKRRECTRRSEQTFEYFAQMRINASLEVAVGVCYEINDQNALTKSRLREKR